MSAARLDLVLRGGSVVDGTGGPARVADVAIVDHGIVAVESVAGRGVDEIDASGLVVAPGFIDPHTHLDANLFWDADVTPSSTYGVTTVVTGNCGYALAPIDDTFRDYVVDAMSTVEQIPREAIDATVPFDWIDLAGYFARLRSLAVALNHATLVGHVPVRAAVLGRDAVGVRAATPEEIAAMVRLVRDGLARGALGFSTDQVVGNVGPRGGRLPGQVAADDELLAIASALRDAPGPGLFALAPRAMLQGRAARAADLAWHERLADASVRPVVVGPVFDSFDEPGVGADLVDAIARANRGGRCVVPQISTRPFELWTRLDAPGVLVRVLPTLHRAVKSGGADGVRALAADPEARATLRREGDAIAPSLVFSGRWDHVHVRYSPTRPDIVDRTVASVAASVGVHPVDVLLDVALGDDFETQVATSMRNCDDDGLAAMVAHPAAMIGASDAGAHVLANTDSCYAVWTLQHWVRERAVLTLEQAVRKLTADQADLLGFADRGRVAPGAAADVVVFDPDRIATTGVRYVADQPAGGTRLVTDATGIAATIVNGVVVARDGVPTGARPGRFLTPGVSG